MGKRFGRQIGEDTFEGISVFEHEGSLASMEEAMEEAPEEEVVDKFKDWMNRVSPEDFK